MSRRCLLEFLYRQIEILASKKPEDRGGAGEKNEDKTVEKEAQESQEGKEADEEDTIFQPRANTRPGEGGYQLKVHSKIHSPF